MNVETILQVTIEAVYGTAMVAVMFFLFRIILNTGVDIMTPLLVLLCWVAGEIMIHRHPMGLGIALYSIGNAILFLYGARLFGLGVTRGVTAALFPVFFITFTGYFLPGPRGSIEPFVIINMTAMYLFFINAVIFTVERSQNRWLYGACFTTLAFWNGGLMVHYMRTGIIITDYSHPFMLTCKGIMSVLLSILALRFFFQERAYKRL